MWCRADVNLLQAVRRHVLTHIFNVLGKVEWYISQLNSYKSMCGDTELFEEVQSLILVNLLYLLNYTSHSADPLHTPSLCSKSSDISDIDYEPCPGTSSQNKTPLLSGVQSRKIGLVRDQFSYSRVILTTKAIIKNAAVRYNVIAAHPGAQRGTRIV